MKLRHRPQQSCLRSNGHEQFGEGPSERHPAGQLVGGLLYSTCSCEGAGRQQCLPATRPADGAGITAFQGMKSTQPARQLSYGVAVQNNQRLLGYRPISELPSCVLRSNRPRRASRSRSALRTDTPRRIGVEAFCAPVVSTSARRPRFTARSGPTHARHTEVGTSVAQWRLCRQLPPSSCSMRDDLVSPRAGLWACQ
jgi:hypothetical protein